MRLNAKYNQTRTTVRIPDELWELFVIAVGSEDEAVTDIKSFLSEYTSVRKESSSASQVARWYIVGYVRRSIAPPIGFNPDPKNDKSALRDAR